MIVILLFLLIGKKCLITSVDWKKVPDYVTLKMENKELKPKQKSVIEVIYNAEKTNFWGFQSDLIPILIVSKKALANAPAVGVDSFERYFKSILSGDKVKTRFKITNIGKRPLIIHNIERSSENLKISHQIHKKFWRFFWKRKGKKAM